MAVLQFRKGTWVLDTTKVNNFIERLEVCIKDEYCDFNDDARSLLAFVKEKKMYNHNQLHMLEALEYGIERKGKGDFPWDEDDEYPIGREDTY